MAEAPLGGLRVVEIGHYVAAPYAATLFADQGADVIKIERPGGDPYRREPARFAAWNRGKRCIELDLTSTEGRAEALGVIEWCRCSGREPPAGSDGTPRTVDRHAAGAPAPTW